MTRRTEPPRLTFDHARFHAEIKHQAKARGISLHQLSFDLGVNDSTISRMRIRLPGAITVIALAKWAGLDAGQFLIDAEDTP